MTATLLHLATHFNDVLKMVVMASITIVIIMLFTLIIARLDRAEQREVFYEYGDEDEESMLSSNLFIFALVVIVVSIASGGAAAYYWKRSGGFVTSWSDARPMRSMILPNGINCVLIQKDKEDPEFKMGMAIGTGSLEDRSVTYKEGEETKDTSLPGLAQLAANIALGESPSVDKNNVTRGISVREDVTSLKLQRKTATEEDISTLFSVLSERMAARKLDGSRIDPLIRHLARKTQPVHQSPDQRALAAARQFFEKDHQSGIVHQFDEQAFSDLKAKSVKIESVVAQFISSNYRGNRIAITIESHLDLDVIQALVGKYFSGIPAGSPVNKAKVEAPKFDYKFHEIIKIKDDVSSPRLMLLYAIDRLHAPIIPFMINLLTKNRRLERLLRHSGLARKVNVSSFHENNHFSFLTINIELRHKVATEQATVNKILGLLQAALKQLFRDVDEKIFNHYILEQTELFHDSINSGQPDMDDFAELVLFSEQDTSRVFIDNTLPSKYWGTEVLRKRIASILVVEMAMVGWLAPFEWDTERKFEIATSVPTSEPNVSFDIKPDTREEKSKPYNVVSTVDFVENTGYGNVAVFQHFKEFKGDRKMMAVIEITPNKEIACDERHVVNELLKDISRDHLVSTSGYGFTVTKKSVRITMYDRPDVVIQNSAGLNAMLKGLNAITDDQFSEAVAEAQKSHKRALWDCSLETRQALFDDMLKEGCKLKDYLEVREAKNNIQNFFESLKKTLQMRLLIIGSATSRVVDDIVNHLIADLKISKSETKKREKAEFWHATIEASTLENSLELAIPFPSSASTNSKTKWIANRMILIPIKNCVVEKLYALPNITKVHMDKIRHPDEEYMKLFVTSETKKADGLMTEVQSVMTACLKELDATAAEKYGKSTAESLASDFSSLSSEYGNIVDEFTTRNDDYEWYRVTAADAKGIKLGKSRESLAEIIKQVESDDSKYFSLKFQQG